MVGSSRNHRRVLREHGQHAFFGLSLELTQISLTVEEGLESGNNWILISAVIALAMFVYFYFSFLFLLAVLRQGHLL